MLKHLNTEQQERLNKTLKGFLILFLVCFLYFIFVKIVGFGIPCIFHTVTGLHCPGCGISRMFIALFKLDFKAAFQYNALIFALSPIALFFIVRHYVLYILYGKRKSEKFETVLLIIALILLIIFGILRNLPTFSFLAP